MTETDWYHGDQKPVRDGVYKRKFGTKVYYSLWWKCRWWLSFSTKALAQTSKNTSSFQSLPWRGLTEEVK